MIRIAGLFAALLCLSSTPVRAQEAPATDAVALSTVSGTAAAAQDSAKLAPADWIKIGKNFGNRGQWQFGFDKSATAGACAAYAVRAHAVMAGPCRDVFLLARDGAPAFHLGAAVLYSGDTPNYTGRLGLTVGPAAAGALDQLSQRIPIVENLSHVKLPAWASYIGKITTVDYMVGRINGQLDHGPEAKVDIPLADLQLLLGIK